MAHRGRRLAGSPRDYFLRTLQRAPASGLCSVSTRVAQGDISMAMGCPTVTAARIRTVGSVVVGRALGDWVDLLTVSRRWRNGVLGFTLLMSDPVFLPGKAGSPGAEHRCHFWLSCRGVRMEVACLYERRHPQKSDFPVTDEETCYRSP